MGNYFQKYSRKLCNAIKNHSNIATTATVVAAGVLAAYYAPDIVRTLGVPEKISELVRVEYISNPKTLISFYMDRSNPDFNSLAMIIQGVSGGAMGSTLVYTGKGFVKEIKSFLKL